MRSLFGRSFGNEELRRLLSPTLSVNDAGAVLACLDQPPLANLAEDWWAYAHKVEARSRELGVVWTYPGLADYPRAWTYLEGCPLVLSYQGQSVWNDCSVLGVVGSREPMRESLAWMSRELRSFLRDSDIALVSGGARGIDQMAHRLCLETERPTILVLPSGLENPYPPGVDKMISQIVGAGGACVSTFSFEQSMRKQLFHIRNRWIAGLASSVLVVECNRRSGTSMTARLTVELGRTLATVPLSPMSCKGQGNLDLLRDGAQLIRDAEDIRSLMMVEPHYLRPLPRPWPNSILLDSPS